MPEYISNGPYIQSGNFGDNRAAIFDLLGLDLDDAVDGSIFVYDSFRQTFVARQQVIVAAGHPSDSDIDVSFGDGSLWLDCDTLLMYVYYVNSWFQVGGSGGGSNIVVSATAPDNPQNGDAWLDCDTLNFFVYFHGWFQVGGGSGGGRASVSSERPDSPSEGDLWIDCDTLQLFAFVAGSWFEIGGSGGGSGSRAVISNTAPDEGESGDLWFSPLDGATYTRYVDDNGRAGWFSG